jgi:hypothetical protein
LNIPADRTTALGGTNITAAEGSNGFPLPASALTVLASGFDVTVRVTLSCGAYDEINIRKIGLFELY